MSAARDAAWLAIINPVSGNARRRAAWTDCERALRTRGIALETVATTRAHDGECIARQAIAAGRRRLLVVGGDGSLHDVVNGVMSARAPEGDRVTIAQAPFGTGNDWARGLGLPRTAEGIAEMIVRGRSRPHDIGMIEFARSAGSGPATRWFVNVAGAGFDAFVVERLQGRKQSNAAYLAGVLRGLLSYDAAEFTISTPEEVTLTGVRLLVAFATIGSHCGGGMRIAPASAVDDGLLELVAIRDPGVLGTLARLRKLYDGSLLRDTAVTHARADRLRIETSATVAVQADGQVVGRTPVDLCVLPRAIDVVVPA